MTEIIIATIMRPKGETGVQTHFNCFSQYLSLKQISHRIITPFSYYKSLVYPIFAIRKIVDKLSGEISVWWYRYWHAYFLRLALRQYLQSGEACVVYAQCPLSADAALRARVSLKQRVVMVTHFNVSQADEWVGKNMINIDSCIYRSIQNFEAEVLPKLDGLVFVSRFMQQELSRRIPAIGTVPFSVMPNFLPDPGEPAIREPVRDLISIGTLEARKNQQYLLEIIAALQESGNPLTLTIVGDGPDRSMLENKTRMLNIDTLVHFAGFVSNAAGQIGLHRACIHVATIENLPITLIEAIARGRPIFAAAVGGVSEVLGEDIAGMALPLNDAQLAAQIIAQAIGNQEWMLKTGIAGRERFLEDYASSVIAKRLYEFLEAYGQYSENGV
jgi:glycosyltransferase involved in cell wall biosynthesis